MHFLLLALGIIGGAAILGRLARALLRLGHGGAEALFARDVASTRARQGDITGLQEAASVREAAVRRRRLALGAAAFWAILLVLPLLTPWPAVVFAAYSVLWWLPRRERVRP